VVGNLWGATFLFLDVKLLLVLFSWHGSHDVVGVNSLSLALLVWKSEFDDLQTGSSSKPGIIRELPLIKRGLENMIGNSKT
jgi:hypothetical protein